MISDLAQALLTTPVCGEPSIRADGTAVAVAVAVAELDEDRRISRIEVVDLDGTTVWHSDGPDDRSPRFAPDGSVLGFTSGSTVRLVSVDGSADRVLSITGSVRRWAWRRDGAAIVATVARPTTRSESDPVVARGPAYKRDGEGWTLTVHDVVVVDVASGTTHTIAAALPAAGDVGWTEHGDVLVCMSTRPGDWRWDLVALDATTGEERWRTDHGEWERAAAPTALPDGTVLYVGGESGPGHARLVRTTGAAVQDLRIGLDRNVTVGAPAYPGAPPVVDGDEVLFTVNDDGCSRLFRVAVAGGTATPASAPGEAVTGLDSRGGLAALTVATERSPGELRISGRVVRRHETLEMPWTVERLAVSAPDGSPVPTWLLRSRVRHGRGPLLLDIHGGPHNASNGTVGTANLHRVILAAAGWHVLLVNPRGSDGSGEAWFRGLEPHGGWASADLQDLLAAVDAAVDAGVADPGVLAVTGYSYGGLAAAALTTMTDRFRAATIGGSIVDLRTFVVGSDLGPRLAAREVGGTPWDPERLDARSPLGRVDRVRTPTLIVHGTDDQRTPVIHAELWYQALQDHGVPSELVLYPGASHGFVTSGRPSAVLDVGRRIADWILHHT